MSDNDTSGEVKRLQPKGDVLRELFLKSGNLCAFPGCNHVIMDKAGLMVGQICHIEAAEKGGERFNPDQTNEQRRAFPNLLLMCHDHHVETNDVDKFTVKRMQEIKANHEAKVSEFIEKTLLTVADQTKLNNPRPAKDCSRLAKLLGWNHNAQELATDAKFLNSLITALSKLPLAARQLLLVMVERMGSSYGDRDMVPPHEVQLACGLNDRRMSELCAILQKYGFIDEGGEDEYGNPQIRLNEWDGCPVWWDLRAFAEAGFATLHELIVDLNFSLLDESSN